MKRMSPITEFSSAQWSNVQVLEFLSLDTFAQEQSMSLLTQPAYIICSLSKSSTIMHVTPFMNPSKCSPINRRETRSIAFFQKLVVVVL